MADPNLHVVVRIIDEEAVADSRDVAAAFDRRHDHVLASIKDLISRRPDLAPCFRGKVVKVATGDGGQRDTPHFMMDRKGFVVLVGGFKGDKALAFRIAFYDAFEVQEAILRHLTDAKAEPEYLPAPDILECHAAYRDPYRLRAIASILNAGRKIFGDRAAALIWADAGLPDYGDRLSLFGGPVLVSSIDESIEAWLGEQVESSGGRVRSTDLHHAYLRWCSERGIHGVSHAKFGRYLKARGLRWIESNGIYYQDISLRPTG